MNMNIDDILNEFENSTSTKSSRDLDNQSLIRCWVNERLTPDLLIYEADLVDRMMERVRAQIEFIELNSIELQNEKEIKLTLVIVESELNRINFLLRSYLRTRLSKIDRFSIFIRSEASEVKKLSNDEYVYMENHLKLLLDLYNTTFLGKLPETLQKIDDTSGGLSMITRPDLKTVVFIRALENNDITVDDEPVELIKGGIYALRYEAIKDLFEKKAVEII
ncbi:unnamed protein product [Kuraishia capsulata CBS 1993]|uniref:DNA replication complex GINS protein SLD5 n=1 Tax=Kuraishia capsulata CBS 1993 TaxID=1382522 RepID=W6MI57_9ASCO|nr:uncharacterized protein KUCA_T00002065001 [Kuraishia capsulata CBS 1993]CDK26094.1 unnamed protein product [Kuraishia capsulata CBS 1993]